MTRTGEGKSRRVQFKFALNVLFFVVVVLVEMLFPSHVSGALDVPGVGFFLGGGIILGKFWGCFLKIPTSCCFCFFFFALVKAKSL